MELDEHRVAELVQFDAAAVREIDGAPRLAEANAWTAADERVVARAIEVRCPREHVVMDMFEYLATAAPRRRT
ncbi:hypothetical protein [Nannocystis pusilla]|uniref:hypothetical protein n=1 Tax=Nannocystis pusilla TaxID=889268 RepID=UPI003BF17E49